MKKSLERVSFCYPFFCHTLSRGRSTQVVTFSAGNIDCDVMRYVETKEPLPYPVSCVNCWPDPTLDFLGPIDIAATVERLRPAYERAKELGLLDHAYIYGFDERGKDQFPCSNNAQPPCTGRFTIDWVT